MSIFLKSNADIAVMKENGKILIEIFNKLQDIVKPGITTKDIDTLVENVILFYSAVPSFKNYRGFPAAACVSVNTELVHGIPSAARVLQEGDIVSIDVGALRNGFHVDAARTYAVGEIADEARRLMDVTRESFFEGAKQAKIGGRLSDISAAIQRYVEAAGFGVIRDMIGHGIGRSLHEEPSVPNYGPPGKGPKLRAGMTLAVEPMVSAGDYHIKILSDGWTAVMKDGKLSAHYENTFAITQDGVVFLTLSDDEHP